MTFGMPPKLASAVKQAVEDWGADFNVAAICRQALMDELRERSKLSKALSSDDTKGLGRALDDQTERIKALEGALEAVDWKLGKLASALDEANTAARDLGRRVRVLEQYVTGPFK